MEDKLQTLQLPNGDFIAYRKHEGKKNHTGILFLGGFMSDMDGTKATALHEYCVKHDYPFVRFDYFGHGQSSKKFTECTIGIWKQNVLDVLDILTNGKQIIVGSSMGGWLMLLAALARPEKVEALVGIAAAPDFTEDLIWDEFTTTQQEELQSNGFINLKSEYGDQPYPITMELIEEGRKHLLLQDTINIQCPVRLIHGLLDKDVPSSLSTRLAMQLASSDVKIELVENGDHRMSTPENIEILCNTIETVMPK